MFCLSRHLHASFFDVRRIVNVHELRSDFHRLSGNTKNNNQTVRYHVDRSKGSLKLVPNESETFRSHNMNQFHAMLGLHMKCFYEDSDVDRVELVVEARRIIGGVEHPGSRTVRNDIVLSDVWEGEGGSGIAARGTSLLCIGHENVDGGHLELKLHKGGTTMRKELSPAFFAALEKSTQYRITPTLSFDGTHDAIQDLFIVSSVPLDA